MFQPDTRPPAGDSDALQFVFQAGRLVTDMHAANPCLLSRQCIREAGWRVQREHFMGYWHTSPCYVVEIEPAESLDPMRFQAGSLYHILGRVDDQLFSLAGRAAQLLAWERDHRFCGRCGQPTRPDSLERAMRCEPCDIAVYPRINPCVIVLVTRGEQLLLARNARFPGPMYSTLAGFIDAGENAEECLHREVREEVGLEIANLRYFRSQSWPFPSQLMLGFFADYAGGDIVCEEAEIADAKWFHYSELPQIPPPVSVAGQLIRHYVDRLGD